MKELLEHLARALVEQPEEVRVTESRENDGSTLLELAVADDDYGKIIGRGGRTAAALRTVGAMIRDDDTLIPLLLPLDGGLLLALRTPLCPDLRFPDMETYRAH